MEEAAARNNDASHHRPTSGQHQTKEPGRRTLAGSIRTCRHREGHRVARNGEVQVVKPVDLILGGKVTRRNVPAVEIFVRSLAVIYQIDISGHELVRCDDTSLLVFGELAAEVVGGPG